MVAHVNSLCKTNNTHIWCLVAALNKDRELSWQYLFLLTCFDSLSLVVVVQVATVLSKD